MYQLLTGKPVFSGESYATLGQKLMALATQTAPPIQERREDVPDELASIVHRMLARSPEERFETPADVAAALAEFAKRAQPATLLARTMDRPLDTLDVAGPSMSTSPHASTPDSDTARRVAKPTIASQPDTSAPAPRAEAHRGQPPWRAMVAVALGVFAIVTLVGMLIAIKTPRGTLLIDVDEKHGDQVEVLVKGNGREVIVSEKDGFKITLKEGQYRLKLLGEADQLSLADDTVTVTRGERAVVTLKLNRQPTGRPPRPADLAGRHVHGKPPAGLADLDWKPLMDGKTLSGWHPVGDGTWTVEDGAFVGRANKEKLYGLLVSDDVFGNFKVRFKFKCLSGDAGFYIRTIIKEPANAHGLQVQVGRVDSGVGGMFESYERGWVSKPSDELEKSYTKDDEWNEMVIDAQNGDVVVCVNGIKSAELKDDPIRPRGHFALQMHSGCVTHVLFKDIEIIGSTFDGDARSPVAEVPEPRKGPKRGLGGILPQPVTVPGVGRWQVETVLPRGATHALAWSPDGKLLACGSSDGSVRIHVATPPFRLVRLLSGFSVAWSPDGRQIACIDTEDRNTIRLWNADGTPGPVLMGHTDNVVRMAWSPDGRWLASGSKDRTVRFWTPEGMPGPVLEGHTVSVFALAWSPDGRRLATGGQENTIRFWDSGGTPERAFQGHAIRDLVWSPDGQRLASAGLDRTVGVWNIEGTRVGAFRGHTAPLVRVAWSGDGQRIVSSSWDGTVRFWAPDGSPGPVLNAHRYCVNALAWSPDSRWLASSGDDAVRLWGADGTAGGVLEGHAGTLISVAWSSDGQRLVSGGTDGVVRLWDGNGILERTLQGHTNTIYSVTWSPDGKRLASTGLDRTVRLWGVEGNPGPVLEGHTRHGLSVAWSPDGQQLASGSEEPGVRLWRADGTPGGILKGHGGHVRSVAWSSDGRWLASGSVDRTVRLWQANGRPGPVLKGHAAGVDCVAWSPDTRWLASSDFDGTIRLWEADGTPGPTLQRSTNAVSALTWSPDSRWLASGNSDGAVLWNADGTPGPVLEGNGCWFRSIAWNPHDQQVALGTSGGALLSWDASTSEPQWTAVPFSSGKAVKFGPAGEVLYGDPDVIEEELIYLVETPDGAVEILKPSEFQKRRADVPPLAIAPFDEAQPK